ncbi:hypothetical protein D3C80_1842860 [compost metagenome]
MGQHAIGHGDTQATGGGIQGQVVEVEQQVLVAALGQVFLRLEPQVPFVARGGTVDQRMPGQCLGRAGWSAAVV